MQRSSSDPAPNVARFGSTGSAGSTGPDPNGTNPKKVSVDSAASAGSAGSGSGSTSTPAPPQPPPLPPPAVAVNMEPSSNVNPILTETDPNTAKAVTFAGPSAPAPSQDGGAAAVDKSDVVNRFRDKSPGSPGSKKNPFCCAKLEGGIKSVCGLGIFMTVVFLVTCVLLTYYDQEFGFENRNLTGMDVEHYVYLFTGLMIGCSIIAFVADITFWVSMDESGLIEGWTFYCWYISYILYLLIYIVQLGFVTQYVISISEAKAASSAKSDTGAIVAPPPPRKIIVEYEYDDYGNEINKKTRTAAPVNNFVEYDPQNAPPTQEATDTVYLISIIILAIGESHFDS